MVLCCATFPLIWIGGLVTSHDAGMAVPDWPSTYGYNLFLYPLSTWVFGPWDLFIEHGHRLLASGVGMLTIALVVAVFRTPSARSLRIASLAALALVIFQGVLGGLRVVLDARTLAMLHGCTGPLFFALCVALATVTSNRWKIESSMADNPTMQRSRNDRRDHRSISQHPSNDRRLAIAAGVATVMTYLQLVLGAQLRHVSVVAPPTQFQMFVTAHLVLAGLLVLQVMYIVALALRAHRHNAWLMRPATALIAIVLTQVTLGGGAWITNYGWPSWFADYDRAAAYTVEAHSAMQANITTAHVAVGSLLLVTALMLSLRAALSSRAATASYQAGTANWQAAVTPSRNEHSSVHANAHAGAIA